MSDSNFEQNLTSLIEKPCFKKVKKIKILGSIIAFIVVLLIFAGGAFTVYKLARKTIEPNFHPYVNKDPTPCINGTDYENTVWNKFFYYKNYKRVCENGFYKTIPCTTKLHKINLTYHWIHDKLFELEFVPNKAIINSTCIDVDYKIVLKPNASLELSYGELMTKQYLYSLIDDKYICDSLFYIDYKHVQYHNDIIKYTTNNTRYVLHPNEFINLTIPCINTIEKANVFGLDINLELAKKRIPWIYTFEFIYNQKYNFIPSYKSDYYELTRVDNEFRLNKFNKGSIPMVLHTYDDSLFVDIPEYRVLYYPFMGIYTTKLHFHAKHRTIPNLIETFYYKPKKTGPFWMTPQEYKQNKVIIYDKILYDFNNKRYVIYKNGQREYLSNNLYFGKIEQIENKFMISIYVYVNDTIDIEFDSLNEINW